MFVQQIKLKQLKVPAKRLRRLYSSTVDVQLALSDYPSQMASAYLAALSSGKGIQLLLGLYLAESRCSVFFLPEIGEIAPAKADEVFEEGLEFAESMGFVLADADIRHMRPEQLDNYWRELPLCRKPAEPKPVEKNLIEKKLVKQKQGKKPPIEKKVLVPDTRADAKQRTEPLTPPLPPVKEVSLDPVVSLEERRVRCKESLGRFLASL